MFRSIGADDEVRHELFCRLKGVDDLTVKDQYPRMS